MLVVGDTVKIVEGAFYDFDGTIQEVPPVRGKGARCDNNFRTSRNR
jgi:transcription antitermination factor NusG